MQISNDSDRAIAEALDELNEMSSQATDGKWLEEITVDAGPHIRDWDVLECWSWADWPDRYRIFSVDSKTDLGIDVVAKRRSDGKHIAVQCKSRRLDEHGNGAPVLKHEMDKFISASANPFWAERWLVTNGSIPQSPQLQSALKLQSDSAKVKWVNIASALQQQQNAAVEYSDPCPHCEPNPDGEFRIQTKNCMQREAVKNSVRILKEHEQSDSGGLPIGQARGRIILPCGTGKTRISLRIVEKLTAQGELSIVLCPSIALVAQIRREYLQHNNVKIRALAVCSDKTAGYNPKKEDAVVNSDDPTIDRSNVSAAEVKGMVTTDPNEIAEWIQDPMSEGAVNVIFGTYQSGRRIAEALRQTETTAKVLIADEAHRTAGFRQTKGKNASKVEENIRSFTLCHDNDKFPATYRVYQTATPKQYSGAKQISKNADYIIRSMDDETVFGVELYRKSYVEAVENEWLSDYRIIALAINNHDAYEQANALAKKTLSKKLNTNNYIRGLAFALAMGGAAQDAGEDDIKLESCIAFMNTVDKSKNMAQDLQTDAVKQWVQKWLNENGQQDRKAADYSLEHLDASSNVTQRDNGKIKLADADETAPHGILNVGIFGEGTDSPSLSAVAFLEPRKSPIDVVQAVGRAMRTAPGKSYGYVICPIVIPANADPEQWLSTSEKEEGWEELGQILLALRAHDNRIEDELEKFLKLYIPPPPEIQKTIVAVARQEGKRIQYREHEGKPGDAERALQRALDGESYEAAGLTPLKEESTNEFSGVREKPALPKPSEPIQHTAIIAGKKNSDGGTEMRIASVQRDKPKANELVGKVNFDKSKKKAKDMINKGDGVRLPLPKPRTRRTEKERRELSGKLFLERSGLEESGKAICMNLLKKSGLCRNRVERDLNILEASVNEAAHHLRDEKMGAVLDKHFGLDRLKKTSGKQPADGSTTAALLMMNAAMLHQRICNGGWFKGVKSLSEIKNDARVIQRICREWERILREDFRPVLEPALETIYAIEETGKTNGLERALRHLAAEAERIAETYADMGADHAGPLFNKVMGNQASDGAFFTRPPAASIAARLTLDACEEADGETDWTDPDTWKAHKTIDLACGSGTLLTAMLTDMKRRAKEQGADKSQISALQKLAVEETIKGLDINPVSLQLAAAQLTAGNQKISYRKMGLYQMPYGPQPNGQAASGTLELLSQKAILPRVELGIPDHLIESEAVWNQHDDAELEDAVDAAKNCRIVIMNPPFSSREKMGEKFMKEDQKVLRARSDIMAKLLIEIDRDMDGFVSKSTIAPTFVALADYCLNSDSAALTMVHPTIALSNTSGLKERIVLAQRYHIHTVVTCHQPGQMNMSHNMSLNESIIIAMRHKERGFPPTRFINLDRMPFQESDVEDLYQCLVECGDGSIANGWGEVSYWPASRIKAGDWTPAVWRSPELAEAAYTYANINEMQSIIDTLDQSPTATGPVLRSSFKSTTPGQKGSFPILKSKGADAQKRIQGEPDEYWISKKQSKDATRKMLAKVGYLLITAGQDTSTGRLTAVACDTKYVGNGWMPLTGLSLDEAKALAVFINSTPGRLQLMRNPGMKLAFPQYSVAEISNIRIPDIQDARVCRILADCWEATKEMLVPQFRDGECEVRVLWDEAVAEAMGWDRAELARLRRLLHQEPHVRGLGYNQYADEA
ncbi:MAG: DEAD/DEAH box helicase family protein [Candidatus Poribacteria bacterium]|nr:DEAD/DEAH box helicase family protein [Candidatus Poribacteria bacterium]